MRTAAARMRTAAPPRIDVGGVLFEGKISLCARRAVDWATAGTAAVSRLGRPDFQVLSCGQVRTRYSTTLVITIISNIVITKISQ